MGTFSIYRNTFDIRSAGELTLKEVYEIISLRKRISSLFDLGSGCDLWPHHVNNYRKYGTKRIKEAMLPAMIFFASTAANDRKTIKEQSGYFCIDLDFADNKKMFDENGMAALKEKIAVAFSSATLIFISPSAKGLKVIHKILPQGSILEDHVWVANKVFDYFQHKYCEMGLSVDAKCKDWNRLCYLSYDREAYYNEAVEAETVAIPEIAILPVPVIMNDENGYQLSRDKRDKDQICPRCNGGNHRDKSFTYYVDKNGSKLDGCGVCSRSKCNANIKPWEVYPNVKWRYLGKVRS